MSTLTTTLLLLVVAVLAGVGLYNLFQNRRSAALRRAEQPASAASSDAGVAQNIPGLGRAEPNLGLSDLPLHADGPDTLDGIDPDSVPEEFAQLTPLEKVAPQTAGKTASKAQVAADDRVVGRESNSQSNGGAPGVSKEGASSAGPSASPVASAGAGEAQATGPSEVRGSGPSEFTGIVAGQERGGKAGSSFGNSAARSTETSAGASSGISAGVSSGAPRGSSSSPSRGASSGAPFIPPAGAPSGSQPGAAPTPEFSASAASGLPGGKASFGSAAGHRRDHSACVLNPLCDCIVEMKLRSSYGAERLLGLSHTLRRVGSKPVVFEGWQVGGGSGYWVPIVAGQSAATFSMVRVGVLLANRHGPLNAMEFSEFTNGLSVLADQLSGSVTLPDMGPVLERARALDDACIELDAQVGLNVDANEPLSPSEIERMAREQRLVERGSNRYARLGPSGEVLFSVSQVEHPNRVTFLLDVPRAPAALQPWQLLVECAKATSVRLQGLIVDDEGRPLTDGTLDQIGEQLIRRSEALELAGFTAGSPVALRLFN